MDSIPLAGPVMGADQKISGAPRGRHKPDYRLCSRRRPALSSDSTSTSTATEREKQRERYRSSGFYEEDTRAIERCDDAMMRCDDADFYVRTMYVRTSPAVELIILAIRLRLSCY